VSRLAAYYKQPFSGWNQNLMQPWREPASATSNQNLLAAVNNAHCSTPMIPHGCLPSTILLYIGHVQNLVKACRRALCCAPLVVIKKFPSQMRFASLILFPGINVAVFKRYSLLSAQSLPHLFHNLDLPLHTSDSVNCTNTVALTCLGQNQNLVAI
jgi:hypothetical protein